MSHSALSLVVLISGRGSNLKAIIEAQKQGLNILIKAVISNNPQAPGLQFAQEAGIPTHSIPHSDYPDRDSFDQALIQCIDHYQPQWVVLAGFMRRLGSSFVDHYHRRILNIHPSLLPKFPGLNTHERALAAHESLHGASIHLVDSGLDSGPILCQASLQIHATDTADSLALRVLCLEQQLYPKVLGWLANGILVIGPSQIFFDRDPLPKSGLQLNLAE